MSSVLLGMRGGHALVLEVDGVRLRDNGADESSQCNNSGGERELHEDQTGTKGMRMSEQEISNQVYFLHSRELLSIYPLGHAPTSDQNISGPEMRHIRGATRLVVRLSTILASYGSHYKI